jgi:hypothetical protein
MKILPNMSARSREERKAEAYRQFLRDKARMGGQLFGPIPAGRRREFFCLDRYTWVWHEEWVDEGGSQRHMTTRYDVRPNGVLKSQGTNSYQQVKGVELKNLYQAVSLYCERLNAPAAN